MTLVVPHAFVASEHPSSASMQSLTDGITQLQGGTPAGGQGPTDFFRAVQVTPQTGLTASTFVSITFAITDELVDVANGHTATTSRYLGKTAGWYEVSGIVAFAANASGRRYAQLAVNGVQLNGTQVAGFPLAVGVTEVGVPTQFVQLNGTTDYVEIQGFSDQASWATAANQSSLNVKFAHS